MMTRIGADTKHCGRDAQMAHGEITLCKRETMGSEPTRGCLATMSRLGRIDTIRFAATVGLCVM